MRTHIRFVVAALIAAAMVVTILATSSSASPPAPTPSHTSAPAAPVKSAEADPEHVPVPPALRVAINASGRARLVDDHGRTLYVFSVDKARKSACDTTCARVWLPVRSFGGKPQPGSGTAADQVGSMQRPDGSGQVTYRGYPVYYSIKDNGPGDRNGEGSSGYGGTWTAVPPTSNAPAK